MQSFEKKTNRQKARHFCKFKETGLDRKSGAKKEDMSRGKKDM
jgi:hypothetical protein